MGEFDYVEKLLEELGGEILIRSVAIRPGKPLAFGRVAGTPFIGSPGNPVSLFVTFVLFVRPFVLRLQGRDDWRPRALRVPADFDWRNPVARSWRWNVWQRSQPADPSTSASPALPPTEPLARPPVATPPCWVPPMLP